MPHSKRKSFIRNSPLAYLLVPLGLAAATIVLLAALSFTLLQPYQMMLGWFFDNSSSAQPQDLLAEAGTLMDGQGTATTETPVKSIPFSSITYPIVGDRYAAITVSGTNVDAPVYYGDTNKILNQGVGTYMDSSGAGLPGEGKTILLALIVVAACFGCVAVADYFFMADFRVWTLAIRAFNPEKLWVSLWYVLFFLVYYVANSVAASCFNYNDVGGKHSWVNTLLLAIAAVFPAPVLLLIQYIPFLSGGNMTWPSNNMQCVWLFPMLVILPLAVVLSRILYRRTKNPYLAGIILGIFVTLITCSNSLTLAM